MKRKAQIWLSREMICGPYLALVRNKAEWLQAFADLGEDAEPFPSSDGKCITLENKEGKLACIVLIQNTEKQSPVQICGLLVHEACHVFQQWCERHGETSPSSEFEAYSIQHIAQQLMQAWADGLE